MTIFACVSAQHLYASMYVEKYKCYICKSGCSAASKMLIGLALWLSTDVQPLYFKWNSSLVCVYALFLRVYTHSHPLFFPLPLAYPFSFPLYFAHSHLLPLQFLFTKENIYLTILPLCACVYTIEVCALIFVSIKILSLLGKMLRRWYQLILLNHSPLLWLLVLFLVLLRRWLLVFAFVLNKLTQHVIYILFTPLFVCVCA